MSLFSHADLLREPQVKKILTLSFSPIHFKFSLFSLLSFLLSHFLLSSPLFLISSLSLFPHPLLSSPPLSRQRRCGDATLDLTDGGQPPHVSGGRPPSP